VKGKEEFFILKLNSLQEHSKSKTLKKNILSIDTNAYYYIKIDFHAHNESVYTIGKCPFVLNLIVSQYPKYFYKKKVAQFARILYRCCSRTNY
jgi:hypothetical protein